MARRPSAPVTPQSANLTVEQMKRGITALQRRINDLEAFDPQRIQQRFAPEVTTLEAAIDETLANVFGHNTVEHNRYKAAASLDNGSVIISMTPDWMGERGLGSQRPEPFQQYLVDGKKQAVLLLGQAIRGLEERLTDHSEPEPAKAHINPAPADVAQP